MRVAPSLGIFLVSWLSFFAGLLGCRDQPPTLGTRGDTDGPLAMPIDRDAIAALLQAAAVSAEDVVVLAPEASATQGRWVRVVEGRIVEVELSTVRAGSGVDLGAVVGRLDALRAARLRGRFESFMLDGTTPDLETLELSTTDRSLRRVVVRDLPRLARLTVHSASLEDVALRGLPALETLELNAGGLETLDLVAHGVPSSGFGVRRLSLAGNALTDETLADLGRVVDLERLEELVLSGNRITSLAALPPLPALRTLSLSDNPLRHDLGLCRDDDPGCTISDDTLPALERLELRRTGIVAVPPSLEARRERTPPLRVRLDEEAALDDEIRRTLERLRAVDAARPGERRTAIGPASGSQRGRSGTCRWSTSSARRAEVRCRLRIASIRGVVAVSLGTTDPAMPFQGGGTPRVVVTLRVGEGAAALWVRERVDHLETVRVVTDAAPSAVERHARPGDRFEGYRRVVARPGQPATATGEPLVVGSEVRIFVEAVGDTAGGGEVREVEVVVEPPG